MLPSRRQDLLDRLVDYAATKDLRHKKPEDIREEIDEILDFFSDLDPRPRQVELKGVAQGRGDGHS